MPKPFCGGPGDFIYVAGPVHLRQEVLVEQGRLIKSFDALGRLEVTPFDPAAGPIGANIPAQVSEVQRANATAAKHAVSTIQRQELIPREASGNGSHTVRLSVGTAGADQYEVEDRCAP